MNPPPDHEDAPQSAADRNTATILNEKRVVTAPLEDDEAQAAMRLRSRRGFLIAAAATVAGGAGLTWLLKEPRRGIFDRVIRFNETISRSLFRAGALAPEFPADQAKAPRVNGTEGLSEGFDPSGWQLQVTGAADAQKFPQFSNNLSFQGSVENEIEQKFSATTVAGLLLSLEDIKALPRVEMVTELKCIEGWSTVVHWAGARVSDFVAKYVTPSAAASMPPYVSLVTPDRGYYVGWDTTSIMHPQTLLCYEMNGEPLTLPHGAPLRLVTTAKYGIKQIKRIGRITFTSERPPDFWAEQGYDWYSGL